MEKKTVGIIGCGNIGSALAKSAAVDLKDHIRKTLLWDTDTSKMEGLVKELSGAEAASDMEKLIKESDLIVEAVSPHVVKEVLEGAIRFKKDVMLMSIGGILGNEGLLDLARKENIRVILPSGAISGIDAIKAAKVSGIDSVTITTRKPVKSIKGAPYFEERGIDADAIKEETVVFQGTAADAIKAFPKNINVSALLSITGIGPEKTKVKIVVSPEYTRNSHEVEVKGPSGTILTRTENVPSPQNPKTSYLAVLSAIRALKDHFDTVKIGT